MDDAEKIAFLERSLKWFIDNLDLHYGNDYGFHDNSVFFYDSGCGCCSDRVNLPDELATFITAALNG